MPEAILDKPLFNNIFIKSVLKKYRNLDLNIIVAILPQAKNKPYYKKHNFNYF